jgi:molecular chaperone DnaJ
MHLEISVETPINLTAKQKELLSEFEALGEENNPQLSKFFSKVKSFWGGLKP